MKRRLIMKITLKKANLIIKNSMMGSSHFNTRISSCTFSSMFIKELISNKYISFPHSDDIQHLRTLNTRPILLPFFVEDYNKDIHDIKQQKTDNIFCKNRFVNHTRCYKIQGNQPDKIIWIRRRHVCCCNVVFC